MKHLLTNSLVSLALCVSLLGCDNSKETQNSTPPTEVLKEDKAAGTPVPYKVSTATSQVHFLMDAELEQISGRAPKSTAGTVNVDLTDLSKTTGLVKIDLLALSVFQKKRSSKTEEFGEEAKNESQNANMRTWLQISEDGPEEQRAANRYAQFKITKVEPKTNVTEMKGDERKADIKVTGTLRLHGRNTEHTFAALAVFKFEGDKPVGLELIGKEPLRVGLEKHDVRPRSGFDVLAEKTLDAMGSTVAKVAEVSLEISATAL